MGLKRARHEVADPIHRGAKRNEHSLFELVGDHAISICSLGRERIGRRADNFISSEVIVTERAEKRALFGEKFREGKLKVQIGARNRKIGRDWIAIDRFDDSELIDYQWDLHCLPVADASVDCIVCNAVLEHVPQPDLAIAEMTRVLKPGGGLWIEVPFLQLYHAHPYDYLRWTVEGAKQLLRRMDVIESGIVNGIAHEARKWHGHARKYVSKPASDRTLQALEAWLKEYDERVDMPALYSGVFIWGEKRALDPEYVRFMKHERDIYAEKLEAELSYSPRALMTDDEVLSILR